MILKILIFCFILLLSFSCSVRSKTAYDSRRHATVALSQLQKDSLHVIRLVRSGIHTVTRMNSVRFSEPDSAGRQYPLEVAVLSSCTGAQNTEEQQSRKVSFRENESRSEFRSATEERSFTTITNAYKWIIAAIIILLTCKILMKLRD